MGGEVPGAARLHLLDGVPLLRPDEQVFEAMLTGWRNQQLARNLAFSTIEGRERAVRAFVRHCEVFPWEWSPQLADEWFTDLRTVRGIARSTLRSYQEALRMFCAFITDPAYGWAEQCEVRFGTHPIQVVHEWNSAVHVADYEAEPTKRAFTLAELQALFDHADQQVAKIRARGRKGWLPAFRDATLLKVAYGFGLRRNEVRMLDVADFSGNPYGPEFGEYGVLEVRYGKAKKGSPPKRRSVLTVWPWVADIVEQWVTEVRPLLAAEGNPALWPSERGRRIGLQRINSRLGAYRDELGLDAALDFHSLRRSYVTHLIESGMDPLFVQQQAGHDHASTTAIYTCVSSDFRVRTLRRALDQTDAGGTTRRQESPVTTKRQVSYQWRLREIMASRGIFTISDLVPPLAERGIKLSVSQVHRLVTGTPERLSLPVLAALCDILEVTPSELIATRAENVEVRRTGTGPDLGVVDMAALRPKRARILPEE